MPTAYHGVELRRLIFRSLKTDSETLARQKAEIVWQHQIDAWEALLAGNTTDAEKRFEAAQRLAEARGFRYLDAACVAELPIEDLLERIDAVSEGEAEVSEAEALLGGAPVPAITVSRALDLYWGLAKDRTLGKSDDQIRRWKNPRLKSVKNFIDVVGDKPIAEISGDDMLDFRDWWVSKIEAEGLSANSANKDLSHLSTVLKTVNAKKRLGLILPLSDLTLKQGRARTRPPFSTGWIRDRLLADGALAGLNCNCLGYGEYRHAPVRTGGTATRRDPPRSRHPKRTSAVVAKAPRLHRRSGHSGENQGRNPLDRHQRRRAFVRRT